jgi:glycerol-3-phosphate dehydrogenase
MMKRFIEDYKGETFDIIVIGGGITGASVAYDAASRGLSVALLEKNDFGWATSAATSKMIHGGLRYLNNLEFGLVRESLRERKIMENIAPNLVYPMALMVPTSNRLKSNKFLMRAFFSLYDILSFDKKWTRDKSKRIPNHKTYSRKKTLEMESHVREENLTGAAVYYDCQSIFPERLTLAFIKSAVQYGAKVANYAQVVDFIYSNGKDIKGVKIRDVLKNRNLEIRGTLVVNCGGPWADIVLDLAEKGNGNHHIRRSEGIHIIIKKMVNSHGLVLLTPKGRFFFILPWRNHSLIGTTDMEYVGNPDNYRVPRERVENLIEEVNETFGDGKLSYDDVLFAYGGLRPLVDDETEGTYESSRKYEIYDNAEDGYDGLITVEGGKYTTSRNLAEKVLNMVEKKLNRSLKKPITDRQHLHGCEIADMNRFLSDLRDTYGDFSANTVEYLGKNYGTESREVFELARKNKKLTEPLTADGEILAEVLYAVKNEMARTLNDILFRRTGFGTLGNPGNGVIKKIAVIAARELKWSDSRLEKEMRAAKQALSLPQ